MGAFIDSLGNAIIFSTLDTNRGYWQVKIKHIDRHKAAFTAHHGQFEVSRIPFEVCNAPGKVNEQRMY